jgi:cytochrome b involved in lipid metabolism
MKRLVRSQMYCLFATSAGMYVLYNEYKDFPLDLLHLWGPYHCYLFEAACGHWLFSLLEDYLVGEEIISHVIPLPDERAELYGWMLNGLMVHQVITLFAYAWCLSTHKLSGLCLFGFMFEAPILLLNVRDLWACFEKEFLHPFKSMDRREVSIFNGSIYFLWHVFRTIPCVLYPLSVLIWRPELNTLTIYSRCVYHFLGLLFCYVNFELIFGIIPRVLVDDWMRARLMSEESHLFNIRVMTGEIDEDGRQLKKKKKKVDEEYVVDVENQNKESKIGLQMMGLEAVGKHNTAEDCWMAIDGNVYDLTAFLPLHPGGSQVLLEVAGKDASKEFLDAKHSMKARKMMTKYMVGHLLGRAYEQKNDVAVDPGMRGDMSIPFEMGRMYITYENSSFCSLCLIALAVVFLQHASYQLGTPKDENNMHVFYGNVASGLGPVLGLLVLSLLFSLVLHQLSFYAARTMEGQFGNTAPLRVRACLSLFIDWRTHISGLGLLLYLLSDYVILSIKYGHALRAMRVSILITCALELAWRTYTGPVALPRTTTFYKALLTFAPVVCLVTAAGLDLSCASSFISRAYRHHHHQSAAEADGGDAASKTYDYVVNDSIFALNIVGSAFVRFLFVRSMQSPRNEKVEFNMTFSRHTLALCYAALLFVFWPAGWFQAHGPEPVAMSMQSTLVSLGATGVLLRLVCAANMALFFASFSKLVSSSTCHFASQMYCIWMCLFLWMCAPPVGSARWVCFILFMAALKSLSFEADVTLETQGADAPNWVYQAKQVENVIRHNISLTINTFVTMPLTGFNSWIAPKSQASFAVNTL